MIPPEVKHIQLLPSDSPSIKVRGVDVHRDEGSIIRREDLVDVAVIEITVRLPLGDELVRLAQSRGAEVH